MNQRRFYTTFFTALLWSMTALIVSLALGGRLALAENIDPANDDSQYAWGGECGLAEFRARR